jgi:hypothetical protein
MTRVMDQQLGMRRPSMPEALDTPVVITVEERGPVFTRGYGALPGGQAERVVEATDSSV